MKMTTKVAVVVGSLRKGSVNRLFAQALAKVARPKLDLQIVEIGDLPPATVDPETASNHKSKPRTRFSS
jgi:chromate reductase